MDWSRRRRSRRHTEAQARGVSRPTNNIEAYDLYLKGRNAMRGQQDKRNVEAAVKLYEDALRVDPRFALPSRASRTHQCRCLRGNKRTDLGRQGYCRSASRVERLDENLVEVQYRLPRTPILETGKFNEAIVELQQALKLAPNSEWRRLIAGSHSTFGARVAWTIRGA